MTEERHNPNELTHADFDALLAEAADGLLHPADMARMVAHAAACELCAPALALATEGRSLLRGLPELEPPAYLVQKVLNLTSETAPRRAAAAEREWSFSLRPLFGAFLTPRFGMSFAMAFFSIMLVLNVAGIKINDLRYVDLRPSAVKSNVVKGYYETTGRVTRYYENLRFVYQVQSTLRDLRNAATSSDDEQEDQQQQPRPGSDTSESPRENDKREKNERYSLERPEVQLAAMPQPKFAFVEDRRTA